MTRDQFAAAALPGLLTLCPGSEPPNLEDLVEWAYKIADEMIRQQKPEHTVDLCASEIACVVADAWTVTVKNSIATYTTKSLRVCVPPNLYAALDRLELGTRPSPMRKERP